MPVADWVPTIRGTCGPTWRASSEKSSPASSSLRTSPAICLSEHVKSSESFKAWATALRLASTERRKSALRTAESGSSSSAWPTPAGSVAQDGEGPATWLARRERLKAKGINGNGAGTPLTIAVQLWPTPTVAEADKIPNQANYGHRMLSNHPAIVGLPDRPKGEKGTGWPTPTSTGAKASGAAGYSTESGRHSGTTLTDAAVRTPVWMTPTTRDGKDGACANADVPTNGLLGRQVLRTPAVGLSTSAGSRVLSPLFTEALMGWPTGWTASASAATVSSPSKPLPPSPIWLLFF